MTSCVAGGCHIAREWCFEIWWRWHENSISQRESGYYSSQAGTNSKYRMLSPSLPLGQCLGQKCLLMYSPCNAEQDKQQVSLDCIHKLFSKLLKTLVKYALISSSPRLHWKEHFACCAWRRGYTHQWQKKRKTHFAFTHTHWDILNSLDIDAIMRTFISTDLYRKATFGVLGYRNYMFCVVFEDFIWIWRIGVTY